MYRKDVTITGTEGIENIKTVSAYFTLERKGRCVNCPNGKTIGFVVVDMESPEQACEMKSGDRAWKMTEARLEKIIPRFCECKSEELGAYLKQNGIYPYNGDPIKEERRAE